MKQKKIKLALNRTLNDPESRYFQPVNDILAVVTLVTILCIVLETVPSLHAKYHGLFVAIESFAIVAFSAEYLCRLYVAKSRRSYAFSFFGIIDLIAILPSFLHLANLTFLKSARVLRLLRLLRMIRLAKLAHFKGKAADAEHHAPVYWLTIQIYLVSLFSALLLLGSLIYVVEHNHPGFSSIPAGMLWAADVILGGGIQGNDATTLPGQIVTLIARFVGLALLGVLVAVVGTLLKGLLFGMTPAKKKSRKKTTRKRSRVENPDS